MSFLTVRERWLIAGIVALFVIGGTVRYLRSIQTLNNPGTPAPSATHRENG